MKIDNYEIEDSSKNIKANKSKILYKFKISDSTPNKKEFMGQCFLLDLNSGPEKYISPSKSIKQLDKLPSIFLQEKNKLIDSLTLQKSKSLDRRINLRLGTNKIKKKPTLNQLNEISIYPRLNQNSGSNTLPTEPKNKDASDSFLNRINRLYYPKLSTIRFLTNLFDDSEKAELKMINLKRIKGKNNKQLLFKKAAINKYNMNSYEKNKNKNIKSFEGKFMFKSNNEMKLKILKLEKQLQNFHKLKINNCKNKVNETLNDLKKLKDKNLVFIEKFKKECDFKFDDNLIY